MSFQIHTPDNQAISLRDLDVEASLFWNKELHNSSYCDPTPDYEPPTGLTEQEQASAKLKYEFNKWPSWFDSIGYSIHRPESPYTSGWDNVKCSLWTIQAKRLYQYLYDQDRLSINLEVIQEHLKPYFDLIDHWAAKGYKPVQVNE